MIELVPISDPSKVWDLAKEHINSAIEIYGVEDIDSIYDDLLKKERQLWMVIEGGEILASVLTTIQEYHGKRYGILTHAGGRDAEKWFHIVNPIGDYFKSEGCLSFQIIGRKGWRKYLEEFDASKIIYERSL